MLNKNICQQFYMRRGKLCVLQKNRLAVGAFCTTTSGLLLYQEMKRGARIRIIIFVLVCSSSFMYHQIPVSCPVNEYYLDLFWAPFCLGRGEAKSSSDIPVTGVIFYKCKKLQTTHQQWPQQKPSSCSSRCSRGGSSHRLLQMEFCNLRGGACDLTEVELLHQLVTAVGLRACHWRAMKHSSLKGSLRVSEQGKEG